MQKRILVRVRKRNRNARQHGAVHTYTFNAVDVLDQCRAFTDKALSIEAVWQFYDEIGPVGEETAWSWSR